MIDDMFVFDMVLHMGSFADLAGEGLSDISPEFRSGIKLMTRLAGGMEVLNDYVEQGAFPPELMGSAEAIFDGTFAQSPTDMALVGNIAYMGGKHPFGGEGDMKFAHQFVQDHPERTIFGGGAEPSGMGMLEPMGLAAALDFIEYQVLELGARSIKFYPLVWTCDDRELAYPMFEKAQSLGVKVLQFHKNIPSALEDVRNLSPVDIQAPSRDFPDLDFVIHHPMSLYFDETVNIVARYANVHLVCSPLLQYLIYKPRLAQVQLGALLQQVGSHKLLYGSEGALLGDPTPTLEAFAAFEVAEDLQEGYGYPEITREDKENILGLNAARLFGIDVESKKKEIANLPAGR